MYTVMVSVEVSAQRRRGPEVDRKPSRLLIDSGAGVSRFLSFHNLKHCRRVETLSQEFLRT